MTQAVCEVCRLLDGDTTLKECDWCDFCKAFICKRDLYSPRRIKAWAVKKGLSLEALKRWLGVG